MPSFVASRATAAIAELALGFTEVVLDTQGLLGIRNVGHLHWRVGAAQGCVPPEPQQVSTIATASNFAVAVHR